MAGETVVGGILGTLRLDAGQFHREMAKAIGEIDVLEGSDPTVKVDAHTAGANAKLAATEKQVKELDRANVKVDKSSRDAGRGMGALATAVIALGPAAVPLAGVVAGIGAGFVGMAAAGLLAVGGIKEEMAAGTAEGQRFSGAVDTIKSDFKDLEATAARGVLHPFLSSVSELHRQMPALNKDVQDFSAIAGHTAESALRGTLSALRTLNPLLLDAGVYVNDLTRRFSEAASGTGFQSFVDWVRSAMPQVLSDVEAVAVAAGHLVAAFAPLGLGTLGMLRLLSDLLNTLPVNVLSQLAQAGTAVFIAFKSYGALSGGIEALTSRVVALAGASTALSVAAGAVSVVLGAAAYLYTKHANAVRADAQAVDDYTQALRESNLAIDANIRQITRKRLADSGALDIARQLGINLADVTDAAQGNADAMKRVNDQIDAGRAAWQAQVKNSREAYGAYNDFNHQAKDLQNILGDNRTALSGAEQKVKDLMAATRQGADATSSQATQLGRQAYLLGSTTTALQAATTEQNKQRDAAQQATTKMQLENDAAGLLRQALDKLAGKTLSNAQAQNSFESSLNSMQKASTKSGKAIKGTSDEAVTLRGNLLQQVQAAQDAAEAYGNMTHSSEKGKQKLAELRDQILKNATAHGLDRQAVKRFLDEVLKVNDLKVKPTKFDVQTSGALQKIALLQKAISGLYVPTLGVHFATSGPSAGSRATGGGLTKADGGIVHYFAQGGFENHVAQIAPRGVRRIWNEPSTGGEAYIPMTPTQRPRSLAITRQVASDFGYSLVPKGAQGAAAVSNHTEHHRPVYIGHLHGVSLDDAQRQAEERNRLEALSRRNTG